MTTPGPHHQTALITGASGGIGYELAKLFARDGYDLVLVARSDEKLARCADELRQAPGIVVHVVPKDLSLPTAPQELVEGLQRSSLTVDALVNNAGFGVPGVYTAVEWDKHAAFLQIMVVAVAELTRRLLPGMIERGYGRIINVASLAGLVPAPAGHTLYAASKAFLIKFSEALAHEVRKYGVHVSAVCPGFTLSEFHDVTGTRQTVKRLPGFLWMDAAAVAREGFAAVMADKPIHVTGAINRTIATLVRYLPQWFIVSMARRTARAYRKI